MPISGVAGIEAAPEKPGRGRVHYCLTHPSAGRASALAAGLAHRAASKVRAAHFVAAALERKLAGGRRPAEPSDQVVMANPHDRPAGDGTGKRSLGVCIGASFQGSQEGFSILSRL